MMSRIFHWAIRGHRTSQLSCLKRYIGSQQQQVEQRQSDYLEVKSDDGSKPLMLSLQWLRDSCSCPSCKHPESGLRLNVIDAAEPTLSSSRLHDGFLHLTWGDGHQTSLNLSSVLGGVTSAAVMEKKRTLWDKATAQSIPFARLDFQQLLTSEDTVATLLDSVLRYGIGIVDGVPPTSGHTKQVMERLGPILRTFWGEVYHVVADLSQFAHPSYTGNAVLLHTDTCYYHQGSGLQAFHVLEHVGQGGINHFVDGFHVANTIKRQKPHVYEYLSKTPVPFKYDEEDRRLHLVNEDYIIRHDITTNKLIQVRYTPYDLDTFRLVSQLDMSELYHNLECWKTELNREDNKHWIHLRPGSVLVTDNWRIFHGRSSFTGQRTLCGMYISRSDFLSRARSLRLI